MQLAPICLFVYNRLDETKITIEALKANFLAAESKLYIFSDGFKNVETQSKVEDVRAYVKTITGFKEITIIESAVNKGLASSIIEGVTKIVSTHQTVIVLEDDLVTTPNFLDFMNHSLQFYKNNASIQSISGFSLKIKNPSKESDVFFNSRAFSWGWATWENRWDENIFDQNYITNTISCNSNILKKFSKQCGDDISEMLLNSISGKNNSWYVRWAFDHFITKRRTVYPFLSKVYNIGFSDAATHCNGVNVFDSIIDSEYKRTFFFLEIIENEVFENEFLKYFSKFYKLKFRLNLLFTSSGRKSVTNEIKKIFFKYH